MAEAPPVRIPVAHRVARVALALAPAIGLVVAWLALPSDDRVSLLAHVLYWQVPVVLLAWGIVLMQRLRGGPSAWRRRLWAHGPGIALAAIATLVVFCWLPVAMRTQFDESSLLGTARCMHENRVAMMATGAVPDAAGPWVVDWNLDKRPPLFAFLVALGHDLTGYRIENAFAVNAFVLFLLLAIVAARARPHLGVLGSLAAPCLLLGVPLVAVCATSAGFDLLATLLLTVVIGAAIDFHREPGPVRASWLLVNALVFALARYESLLVAAVIAALVAATVRRWPRDASGRWLLAAVPTLLMPSLLLLVHAQDRAFYFEAEGRELVSLANFATHAARLPAAYCGFAAKNAFPGPLALVSLAALGVWLWRRRGAMASAFVLAPIVAVTMVVLAWFYGDVEEASAARLFLPIAALGAFGPLLLLRLWPQRWLALAVFVGAALWAGWRLHAVATAVVQPRSRWAQALDAVDTALAGLSLDPRRTLLVSTVAQYLIVRGYAAVPPVAFARGRGRNAADVVVLETTLDAQLVRQVGDPKELLRGVRVLPLSPPGQGAEVLAWRLAH